MFGENTGVIEGAAAGSEGVESTPDAVQEGAGVEGHQPEEQHAEEIEQRSVPVHVLQAMRAEMAGLKEKAELASLYEQRLREFQSQPPQGQQQQNPYPGGQQSDDPFVGKDPNDIPTYGELKGIIGRFASEMEMMRTTATNPNWQQEAQEHLMPAVQANPELRGTVERALRGTRDQVGTVIAFTRLIKAMKGGAPPNGGQQPPQKGIGGFMAEIDKLISNSSKPGAPASGGGASILSQAQRVQNMSRDDFLAYKEEVKRKGGAF